MAASLPTGTRVEVLLEARWKEMQSKVTIAHEKVALRLDKSEKVSDNR